MRRSVLVGVAFALLVTVVAGQLSFTVLGDWGKKLAPGFVRNIAKYSEEANIKFIAAIGDNFYSDVNDDRIPIPAEKSDGHGVSSVKDLKWKVVYEEVFDAPIFKKTPWMVALGNHDYDGNEQAQLEYAKTHPRWVLPRRYYSFKRRVAPNVEAQFFVLDSTPLYYKAPGKKMTKFGFKENDFAQLQWLERALKASTAEWKIVFAHHQIFTSVHASSLIKKLVSPLLEKYGVTAYINGHIHNIQHVQTKSGLHYLTLGNVACQQGIVKKSKPHNHAVKFAWPSQKYYDAHCGGAACRGFSVMTIKNRRTMVLEVRGRDGKIIYTTEIMNRQK